MKQRAKTALIITLVTVLAILSKLLPNHIGDYVFDVFVLAIVIVAGFEMSQIMEKMGKNNNRFFATMYGIFNYIILLICLEKIKDVLIITSIQLLGLVAYFIIVLLAEIISDNKKPIGEHLKTSFNTILCCIYPTFWFCLMLIINHIDKFSPVTNMSMAFIVLIFAVTMLTDTFAYLVGSRLKGPKLAPSISPNKTISGAIGGLIGGIAGAMILFAVVKNVPAWNEMLSVYSLDWWHFLLVGLFASVCGQAGDLFESKLKRMANVKDSGTIFPGHGGMMDRVDAMTFVTAFVYVFLAIIII